MKKNLTINMFGTLFCIDEDAYELLKEYIDNLKAWFGRQEGGEEIVDDLERRIAELLSEYRQEGVEAITKEHVETVIRRIGRPEQMTDGEEEQPRAAAAPKEAGRKAKRFMRDSRDKMLGGLVSGLATYLGADVTLLRVLLVLLTLFSHMSLLLVYLVAWLIVPEARLAEDFLAMEGRPVSPSSIGETLVSGVKSQLQPQSGLRKALSEVLRFLMKVFKVFLYLMGIFFLFILILLMLSVLICVGVAVAGWLKYGSPLHLFYDEMGDWDNVTGVLSLLPMGTTVFFWLLLAGCLLLLFVPVYCFIHHLVTTFRGHNRMTLRQRLVWLALWLVSLLLIIISGVRIAGDFDKAETRYDALHPAIPWETGDGEAEWMKMYKVYEKNDARRFVANGAQEGTNLLKFERKQESLGQGFERVSVVSHLNPGIYRLRARVFTNRPACMVFAEVDSLSRSVEVPYGTADCVAALSYLSLDDPKLNGKSAYTLDELPETVVDSIVVAGTGAVKYGIRSNGAGKEVNYYRYLLYDADYRLERVAGLPVPQKKKQ